MLRAFGYRIRSNYNNWCSAPGFFSGPMITPLNIFIIFDLNMTGCFRGDETIYSVSICALDLFTNPCWWLWRYFVFPTVVIQLVQLGPPPPLFLIILFLQALMHQREGYIWLSSTINRYRKEAVIPQLREVAKKCSYSLLKGREGERLRNDCWIHDNQLV